MGWYQRDLVGKPVSLRVRGNGGPFSRGISLSSFGLSNGGKGAHGFGSGTAGVRGMGRDQRGLEVLVVKLLSELERNTNDEGLVIVKRDDLKPLLEELLRLGVGDVGSR